MQKKVLSFLFFTILCLSLINGCGRRLEDHEAIPSADCPAQPDTTVQESTATEDTAVTAPPVVEIYAGGDAISIPPDQMQTSQSCFSRKKGQRSKMIPDKTAVRVPHKCCNPQ